MPPVAFGRDVVVTDNGRTMVMVWVADLVASVTEVAVIVTFKSDVRFAGAAKVLVVPDMALVGEMEPHFGAEQVMLQVIPSFFVSLLTMAVSVVVAPVTTVDEADEIATVIGRFPGPPPHPRLLAATIAETSNPKGEMRFLKVIANLPFLTPCNSVEDA